MNEIMNGFPQLKGRTRYASGVQLDLVGALAARLAFAPTSYLAASTDLVVAADGSGQFKTVQEAIMAVPAGSTNKPVFIHLQPGIYKELIYAARKALLPPGG